MNASVRAPRSGSTVTPKLSPVVHRATVPNDWEISQCTNKPPVVVGANNRKRMTSARSSSPPQWAGQRPQKNSRTARRSNFVPIVSSNEENPAVDSASDVTGSDIGPGFPRRLPGSSPQQVKLKGEALSSAALSESEVSSLVLPSRKNKLAAGEELGDGVRRQGRTGRGFASTRSLVPMTVEKMGNVGTAKQLRSSRLGVDKSERFNILCIFFLSKLHHEYIFLWSETLLLGLNLIVSFNFLCSKAGRPPTRRLSDRKPYTRQKHTAINTAADFLGSYSFKFLTE